MSETHTRVVQWATGNVGTKSLRAVIEHPQLELVGLYVHSADKVGKDAGELCGEGHHRRARDQLDRRRARPRRRLRAVHAAGLRLRRRLPHPRVGRQHRDDARRVPPPGEYGSRRSPASRRRVRQGRDVDPRDRQQPRVHLGSTPPRPAVDGRAASSCCRSTSSPTCRRATRPKCCSSSWASAATRRNSTLRRFGHIGHAFGPSLSALADAIGLPIDSIESGGEIAVATHDVEIAAGTVPAGTVAAQRPFATAVRERGAAAAVPGELVRHHRSRAGVGSPRDRLARAGRRRHPARPRDPVPGRARALPTGVARVHRAPRCQRHHRRLRRSTRDPHHRRPPPGRPHLRLTEVRVGSWPRSRILASLDHQF